MSVAERDATLSAAFIRFADVLTTDYDVVEVLHAIVLECVELLVVDAAGLLLVDADGELELVASTSEGADFVEVMQLNAGDGPCIHSFRTGSVISVPDVRAVGADWEHFRLAAAQRGYGSAYAVPLRLRGEAIGSLGLFRRRVGELEGADAAVAQALAALATIAIVQERTTRESTVLAEQLQRALESRIVIEQAKGILGESAGVDMDEAFRMLRQHARGHNLNLRDVAERVVARSLSIAGDRPSADRVVG
ncbi:GAF and ANTAR domain-containing protein [Agrococcus lahaulensis]|uniref:GAF and ANTAR domain-containing protein n=1 Tax=Agrococcus lahaulensis TaxID=341722 RepID=UPI00047B3EB1|nr:GAF and ANTAR domain-containing protein [Agrococcus lahaulensis]